jgi:hypothetical protein
MLGVSVQSSGPRSSSGWSMNGRYVSASWKKEKGFPECGESGKAVSSYADGLVSVLSCTMNGCRGSVSVLCLL